MKKFIIILLLIISLLPGKFAMADEIIETKDIDDGKIETLYNYITNMKGEFELLNNMNPKDYVQYFIKNGQGELNKNQLYKNIVNVVFKELLIALKMIGIVVVIAVICALMKNLQSAFNNESLSNIAYFACYALLIIILSKSFMIGVDLVKSTIINLTNFMAALLPVLMMLLVTVGGLAQAATMDPIILAAVNLSPRIYVDLIIPLILMGFMLQFASNISEDYKISKLTKLVNQIVLWIQGILVTVFIGILTIRGMTTNTLDAVTAKTAKFAIDNFIPIVGKALSDAVATVAGYSLLLKNALSSLGLFIIIIIVIIPIIKVFIMSLLYKFTAALLEPICDGRIVNCISSVGESLVLIMSCLISVSVMFFIMIAIMASAGKFIIGA